MAYIVLKLTGSRKGDREFLFNRGGPHGQKIGLVSQENGLLQLSRNKEHRDLCFFVQLYDIFLHDLARHGVETTKRLIHK